MGKPRLLWVNSSLASAREASTSEFARLCDVTEIECRELGSLDARESGDLICFNFDYPDMAALRLIPETKRRWPSVPILMITMQSSTDLALWALRSRVFDLLIKPLTSEEVGRCLQRVYGALQARRCQSGRAPQEIAAQLPAETRYRAQPGAQARLQAAIAYMVKNYPRHIPESEVARLCEMSPSRFCREFRASFGVTFVEYLSNHRVSEAKRLLANPSMSVTDVASAVGFGDPSYFTRVFRKQEGASPSEYRAQLCAAVTASASDGPTSVTALG